MTSARFKPWAEAYAAAAIASCPVARPTTFCFSPSGSDASGDGSAANPYQSLAKANAVIAASTGDVAVLFRRGGVWRLATGLVVNRPHVTVGAYSASGGADLTARPVLTRFEAPVAKSAWTAVSGYPNVYSAPAASTLSWVKLVDDEATVFRRVASLDEVAANAASWFQNGGTVYLHLVNDTDPRQGDRLVEGVFRNQATGIQVTDVADVRIDGLRVEGFGAGAPKDQSYKGYGIEPDVTGTNRVVVTDCEVVYNGRHNIAKNNLASASGGSLVVANCRFGWMANDTINVVSYATLGGQELVSVHNVFVGGGLPDGAKPYATGGSGGTNYAHTTNTASYKTGFFLCMGNVIVPSQFQNSGMSTDGAAAPFADLKDCRSFVLDEVALSRRPTAFDATKPTNANTHGVMFNVFGSDNTAYVGCDVRAAMLWTVAVDNHLAMLSSTGGVWINCDLGFDYTGIGASSQTRIRSWSSAYSAPAAYRASFYNCRIDFQVAGGNCLVGFAGCLMNSGSTLYGTAAGGMGGQLMNSIVTCSGIAGGGFRPAWNNDGAALLDNAYPEGALLAGIAGCDLDPYRTTSPYSGLAFGPDSSVAFSTPCAILGYRLEYDKLYRLRYDDSARGPFERP